VLNNLKKKKGEGRYVKVELDRTLVTAFQLIETNAPDREVELIIQLLSETKPLEIHKGGRKGLDGVSSNI